MDIFTKINDEQKVVGALVLKNSDIIVQTSFDDDMT